MNPIKPSVGTHRTRLVVLLTVAVALFITTGCGKKGGDDNPKKPSSEWDKMKWGDVPRQVDFVRR